MECNLSVNITRGETEEKMGIDGKMEQKVFAK